MFKIFKPNRRKWQSNDQPSSMPHRTSNFNFQSLSKSKRAYPDQKTNDLLSIDSVTNRFLQYSTTRSVKGQGLQSNNNNYSILKQRMNEKAKIYSSQKSLKRKQSMTQRSFFNGYKSTENLMDFKRSNMFKIDLDKVKNPQPRNHQTKIMSRSNNITSSKSFRKSVERSAPKENKTLNCEFMKKATISKRQPQVLQESFSSSQSAQSQYCTIIIYIQSKENQQQISVRYKVKKIGALIKFLKNYMQQFQAKSGISNQSSQRQRQIVSFQTTDYNLQLDYYLTLHQEDGSFLNGVTIAIKPVYSIKQPVVTLSSFQIIQCIGSGGFSNVYLCRFKENGRFYAMKVISKAFIVKHQKKKIIMNERNIMVELRDQLNIAKLYYAFQAKEYIVFVMEYYEGGELFNLVKRFRKMDQKTARFYITEVLLGLQQIHDHNIVYRDFKPQNIMIDIDGHAYIADFGLAKPNISTIDDRAYSFCGSPEYMPPEMILKDGHSLPVDFYCLGALLYELVTGLPPFYNTDPQSIYEGTLNQELTFPDHAVLSSELQDLLLSLLCKDQRYRLGSAFGVKEILSHSWFKSVKKQDFKKKMVTPPIDFKRIEDLRFNIDEMHEENQKQMKQILKNQKLEASSKYLKIMNGFYYDYRFDQNTEQKENDQLDLSKGFKKNKMRLSSEKTKNSSESIALTNCTKRSQNSLILGSHFDLKNFPNNQNCSRDIYKAQQQTGKSSLSKENSGFFKGKKISRELKPVEKRLFQDMNNFFVKK